MTRDNTQPLESRILTRLEAAVAKSEYVGQGKKLKVTNTVRFPTLPAPGPAPSTVPTTALCLSGAQHYSC